MFRFFAGLFVALVASTGCVEIAEGEFVDVSLEPNRVGHRVDGELVVAATEVRARTDDADVRELAISVVSMNPYGYGWLTCGSLVAFSLYTGEEGDWLEEAVDLGGFTAAGDECQDPNAVLGEISIAVRFHALREQAMGVQVRFSGELEGTLQTELTVFVAHMVNASGDQAVVSGLPMPFPQIRQDQGD